MINTALKGSYDVIFSVYVKVSFNRPPGEDRHKIRRLLVIMSTSKTILLIFLSSRWNNFKAKIKIQYLQNSKHVQLYLCEPLGLTNPSQSVVQSIYRPSFAQNPSVSEIRWEIILNVQSCISPKYRFDCTNSIFYLYLFDAISDFHRYTNCKRIAS